MELDALFVMCSCYMCIYNVIMAIMKNWIIMMHYNCVLFSMQYCTLAWCWTPQMPRPCILGRKTGSNANIFLTFCKLWAHTCSCIAVYRKLITAIYLAFLSSSKTAFRQPLSYNLHNILVTNFTWMFHFQLSPLLTTNDLLQVWILLECYV